MTDEKLPPTDAELLELRRALAETRGGAASARDVWRCPWCGSPTSGPRKVCRAHEQLERSYQQARWGNRG